MDIIRLNSGTDPVYRLFCEYAEGEQLYKRLDREEFERRFFGPQDGYEKVFLCAMNGDSAAGFAAGLIKLGGDVSYVTAILTAAEYRRMGLGTALISALEAAMKTPDTKRLKSSSSLTLRRERLSTLKSPFIFSTTVSQRMFTLSHFLRLS